MCRRKSKQAMRDYKKVLVQLETLEINVGDQCRKEFTGVLLYFLWFLSQITTHMHKHTSSDLLDFIYQGLTESPLHSDGSLFFFKPRSDD